MDIVKKIFPVIFAVAGIALIIFIVNKVSITGNLFLILMGVGLGLVGVTMAWFLAISLEIKK